jgi:fatty acid desaturase
VSADHASRPAGLKSLARAGVLTAALLPTTVLVLAWGSWWLWPLHWLAASVVFATLPSAFHEGAHRNLTRHRWLNDGAATFAAALQFVPFATWRYFHLAHHANTGTDQDPEDYPAHWSKWSLLTFPLFQFYFIYILWKWSATTAAGHGPRWIKTGRQIRAVRGNSALTLLAVIAVVSAAAVDWQVAALVIVPSLGGILLSSCTIVPEHFPAHRVGPGEPDQLDRTGTFQSNFVTRFVMWNSNFHAAHHFAPKVPAHYLPKLDSMVSDIQDPQWRWTGYCTWYRQQLRRLPWWPPVEPGKAPIGSPSIIRSSS